MKGAWLASVLCLIVPVVGAGAPAGPRQLMEQGNAHFAAGAYTEALRAYEAAAAAGVLTPELLHDQAAARFKLGEYAAARELWERAAPLGDAAYEGRMRYNLGNCDYAEALAAQAVDPQQTVQLLDQAAERYREALRLDPTLADARANLELTQLLKQQIAQAPPQCQQSQDSEGGDSQENEQKQQSASQPSSQPQQKSDQQTQESSDKPQAGDQEQAQSAAEQSSAEDEPQNDSSSQQEQKQSPAQHSAEEEEGEDQRQAASEEQSAADEAQQEQKAADDKSDESRNEQQVQAHLTPEQAERLLQMVRDAEKARREKLARQRAAHTKPVERDW